MTTSTTSRGEILKPKCRYVYSVHALSENVNGTKIHNNDCTKLNFTI